MSGLWARLRGCERKVELLLGVIADLKRQVRELQQQLRDLRGT
jgi:hypothetical protein